MRSKYGSFVGKAPSTDAAGAGRDLRMMLILAIRSAMLTYFDLVVNVSARYFRSSAALTLPLRVSCRSGIAPVHCRCCLLKRPHEPDPRCAKFPHLTSGADHSRSAVLVQKLRGGRESRRESRLGLWMQGRQWPWQCRS